MSIAIAMTTTVKLNPTQLLFQRSESNSYGCLEVDSGLVAWKIYLHRGKIRYVYCSVQSLNQLKYYLYYLKYKQAIAGLRKLPQSFLKLQSSIQNKSSTQNIYDRIIPWLLTHEHLELEQTKELIKHINKDNILSLLCIDNGVSVWQEGHSLPLWIPAQIEYSLSTAIAEYLQEQQTRLKQWQNCSSELKSVYQRPYFPPGWNTKPLPESGSLNQKTLTELTQVLRGRTSIRQLSILLNKDELQIAQVLSPYIERKIIYLHHAQGPLDKLPLIPRKTQDTSLGKSQLDSNSEATQNNTFPVSVKTWKIVCIDDSPTILGEIKRFLDRDKFDITAVGDPVQAVSKIFTINPDLILLDITMPRINGYKLCGLLRSSGKCDSIPIIMVTGNTGFIDKARAKISGATDYFTKPFTKQELNRIVQKYLA